MPGPEQPVESDEPIHVDRPPSDQDPTDRGSDRTAYPIGTGYPDDPDDPAYPNGTAHSNDSAYPDDPAGSNDPEGSGTSGHDGSDTDEDPEAGTEDAEKPPEDWWADPRMPWKGKPGRNDILCWIGISLSGVLGLIMIPLRPILLGSAPLALVAITGSRSGLVTSGALADIGQADWWPIALIVGLVSAMKWDPLFWWAGRLWGPGLIDMMASRSRWARMNAERAERLARKYSIPAVLLTYILPIPAAVVYGTVGMAGMRLRTFVITTLCGSAFVCSLWVYLGFRLGQRAVDVVDVIARYSGYIALALVAVIIINAVWRGRAGAQAAK